MKNQSKDTEFVNPIDPDKVAENPGLLPYGHHSGSALIKPEDMGRVKGNALAAMEDQTDIQLDQIKEQIELLAEQARRLQRRKEISLLIYQADVGFQPLINHRYYLYSRKDGSTAISMVSPSEWGSKLPFDKHLATVRLMADHTWEVLEDYYFLNLEKDS